MNHAAKELSIREKMEMVLGEKKKTFERYTEDGKLNLNLNPTPEKVSDDSDTTTSVTKTPNRFDKLLDMHDSSDQQLQASD